MSKNITKIYGTDESKKILSEESASVILNNAPKTVNINPDYTDLEINHQRFSDVSENNSFTDGLVIKSKGSQITDVRFNDKSGRQIKLGGSFFTKDVQRVPEQVIVQKDDDSTVSVYEPMTDDEGRPQFSDTLVSEVAEDPEVLNAIKRSVWEGIE